MLLHLYTQRDKRMKTFVIPLDYALQPLSCLFSTAAYHFTNISGRALFKFIRIICCSCIF